MERLYIQYVRRAQEHLICVHRLASRQTHEHTHECKDQTVMAFDGINMIRTHFQSIPHNIKSFYANNMAHRPERKRNQHHTESKNRCLFLHLFFLLHSNYYIYVMVYRLKCIRVQSASKITRILQCYYDKHPME